MAKSGHKNTNKKINKMTKQQDWKTNVPGPVLPPHATRESLP